MNLFTLQFSLISCKGLRFGITWFLFTLVITILTACSSAQPTATPLPIVPSVVNADSPGPDNAPNSLVDRPAELTPTPTLIPTITADSDAVNTPTPIMVTPSPTPPPSDIPDPATATPTATASPIASPGLVETGDPDQPDESLACEEWPACDPDFWLKAEANHITLLLESGTDVNAADESQGRTALHFATIYGRNPTTVDALLAAGADPNALTTDFKYAPLHYAALYQSGADYINALVKGGANVNIAGANSRDSAGTISVTINLTNQGQLITDFSNSNTPLHVAASRNQNPSVIRALVESGADVDGRNSDGDTPLHSAASFNGNPSIISLLLELGADINARNRFDDAPLHNAAEHNYNPSVISLLLELDADVNARNRSDDTPLHKAAEHNNNVEITVALIAGGADINAIGFLGSTVLNDAATNENSDVLVAVINSGADVSQGSSGSRDTALHSVAAASDPDPTLIDILLDAGIDINEPGIWDQTPLHKAAYFNRPLAFIRALIDAGANINAKDFELLTPCQLSLESTFSGFDNNNANAVQDLICPKGVRTPRQFAEMISTDPEVINFLIQGWGDNELTTNGKSPLHYAAESSEDRNAIDTLLKAGIEPNPRDFTDWTPLHLAARNNPYADVLRALIEGGADVNAKEGFRRTPLKMAIEHNPDLFVIIALLEGGADIFYSGDDGRTACESLPDVANRQVLANVLCIGSLHDAAEFGLNAAVITQLIEKGADPNGLDQEGLTPLHLAAFNPRPEILEALISAGSSVDSRIRNSSFNEETPLHVAMGFNTNPAVVDALILAGAKVNARTRDQDRTPLHYAVIFNELPYVIPALVEHGANLDAADYTGSTPCDYFDRSSLPAESRNLVCR